jgi:hypothetical protein
MASNRSDNSNTGNNKAKASGDRSQNDQPRGGGSRAGGNQQSGQQNGDDRASRVRDDGRVDDNVDDQDRTDQRMTAQNEANRQAHEAMEQGGGAIQGGEQIDHGSHARAGMGQARQTDGS